MSFRIGETVLTPNSLMLPLALAFFFMLSYQRLYPSVARTRFHAYASLTVAALCGALGAWAYGASFSSPEPNALHAWLDVRFGSFGGYWGAVLGGLAYAWVVAQGTLKTADALVPGILIGGSIARIGCVFTGCCRGIAFSAGVPAFPPWPCYDIAALMLTLGVIVSLQRTMRRCTFPGGTTGLFLTVYGLLRFLAEFLRVMPAALGPLSSGQVAALIQCLAGPLLLASLTYRTGRTR